MGVQFKFWWECAKRARRGTAAFANDWQWVFGSPAVALGLGTYIASSRNEAASVTTGSPTVDAFLAAFAAFIVTWLVAFLINLARAPAQIADEDKKRADEALKKLEGIELTIQKVTFEEPPNEDIGDIHFILRNGGKLPTTIHNWSASVIRPKETEVSHLHERVAYFPRRIPSPDGKALLLVDNFANDPMPVGARREARYSFVHHGVNVKEAFGIKGTKFTVSCEDGRQMKHQATYVMP